MKISKGKILFFILLVALVSRLPSLWYGLPHLYFLDEYIHIANALKIIESANPFLSFSYLPPLVSYLTIPIIAAWGIFGIIFGSFAGVEGFREFVILNSGHLVIISRIFSIVLGVGTVYVVYLLGKQVFNTNVGLLGAAVVSLDFMHVMESQAGRIWVGITFAIVLLMYLMFKLLKTGKMKWYAWSAVVMGFGWGVGYIPIGMIVWFLYVQNLVRKKFKRSYLDRNFVFSLVVIVGFVIFFSLANTYSVQRQFGRGFNTVANVVGINTQIQAATGTDLDNVPKFAFNYDLIVSNLSEDMFLIAILAIIGFVVLLKGNKLKDERLIFVAYFPFIYLILLPFVFGGINNNYMLPAMPFMGILGSFGLLYVIGRIPKKIQFTALVIALLVVFIPRVQAIGLHGVYLVKDDTRLQAVSWVTRNVPTGSTILTDIEDLDLWITPSKEGIEFKEEHSPGRVRTRDLHLKEMSNDYYPYPSYVIIGANDIEDWQAVVSKYDIDYVVRGYDNPESENIFRYLSLTKEVEFFPTRSGRGLDKFMEDTVSIYNIDIKQRRYGPYVEIYGIY